MSSSRSPQNLLLLALSLLLVASRVGATVAGAWIAEGEELNANFGDIVGTAGDVNGDGYSDTFIGAPGANNGLGELYVYHGGPGGLAATPAWTLTGTGDGVGGNAACAGDVNGDGYDDLLAGRPLYLDGQQFEGRVELYLGSPSGLQAAPVWTMDGDSTLARLGRAGSAGDFNGDGYGDFLLGAPGWFSDAGKAWLFLGDPSGVPVLEYEIESGAVGQDFGFSFAAGDANADGFDDVLIGAPYGGYLVHLAGTNTHDISPTYIYGPNGVNGRFALSLSTAGDVNLDGYCDFVVGAPEDSLVAWQEGALYLYRGHAGGISSTPAWTFHSQVAGAHLGHSVACAGDVNGDGRPDLAAGAPFLSNGNAFEGRGYLLYGNATGYDQI